MSLDPHKAQQYRDEIVKIDNGVKDRWHAIDHLVKAEEIMVRRDSQNKITEVKDLLMAEVNSLREKKMRLLQALKEPYTVGEADIDEATFDRIVASWRKLANKRPQNWTSAERVNEYDMMVKHKGKPEAVAHMLRKYGHEFSR